jgi:RNA polymerase sigma-70 factor (sigma-E family)
VQATLAGSVGRVALPACRTKLRRTVDVPASEDERFAEFVRTSAPQLARTAYLLTGNRASAEDLVQDALLRLYRRRSWLLGAQAPVAYARRTLTNLYINDRRRRASTEFITDEVPERATESDISGIIAERDALWARLGSLPAKQRAAIVLRYYHDLSDSDIGAALECREGTVRSLISRGLAALRIDPEPSLPPGRPR